MKTVAIRHGLRNGFAQPWMWHLKHNDQAQRQRQAGVAFANAKGSCFKGNLQVLAHEEERKEE